MKKFIIKSSIYSLILISLFFACLSLADGHTDSYYIKLTTPKQSSLIVGTSLASLGIQPRILKEQLGIDIYNYSFTGSHSPYGKTYYDSIKKKVDKKSENGIFIVTVNPTSIAVNYPVAPDDEANFPEILRCLGNTSSVTSNPNFEYLLKNKKGKFHTIILNRFIHPPYFVHNDGWEEIHLPNDSTSIKERETKKINAYKETYPNKSYSQARIDYLLKTIEFLKKHGKVYLIRLPRHPDIIALENLYLPNFNTEIATAINSSQGYLDLSIRSMQFTYLDGSHLSIKSSIDVSTIIANWINQ